MLTIYLKIPKEKQKSGRACPENKTETLSNIQFIDYNKLLLFNKTFA